MTTEIARARGVCFRCRRAIEIGQEIETGQGMAATHSDCAPFVLPAADPLTMGYTDLDMRGLPPLVYTSRSCSWCGQMNLVQTARCRNCGHDAQRPRMECTCPSCQKPRTV